jgi:extradiol dioxygenase family protein
VAKRFYGEVLGSMSRRSTDCSSSTSPAGNILSVLEQ